MQGRIEAYIALKSWVFGFRPCSGQGQFTLPFFLSIYPASDVSDSVQLPSPVALNFFQVQLFLATTLTLLKNATLQNARAENKQGAVRG